MNLPLGISCQWQPFHRVAIKFHINTVQCSRQNLRLLPRPSKATLAFITASNLTGQHCRRNTMHCNQMNTKRIKIVKFASSHQRCDPGLAEGIGQSGMRHLHLKCRNISNGTAATAAGGCFDERQQLPNSLRRDQDAVSLAVHSAANLGSVRAWL